MTEFLETNAQDLFKEIVEKSLAEGISSQAEYAQMVETVLENRREAGELHDDNDIEGLTVQLVDRWPEYEARLNEQVI